MAKLFWAFTAITVFLLALQLFGYPTVELIIFFLIIDLVVLNSYSGKKVDKFSGMIDAFRTKVSEIQNSVFDFKGSIEELKSFMQETKSMRAAEQTTMGTIQAALDRHKEDLRMDFKNDMDRMAGKFIEMENDFHDFKRGFASAIGAMDDRLKMIEAPNGGLGARPEIVAEQIQEEYAEIAPENQN